MARANARTSSPERGRYFGTQISLVPARRNMFWLIAARSIAIVGCCARNASPNNGPQLFPVCSRGAARPPRSGDLVGKRNCKLFGGYLAQRLDQAGLSPRVASRLLAALRSAVSEPSVNLSNAGRR